MPTDNFKPLARRCAWTTLIFVCSATGIFAQTQATLSPDVVRTIDETVQHILLDSGAPSAALAVVKDGRLAYVYAYGKARLDPPMLAQPTMRYSIGSVSKQFTSTALLMLGSHRTLHAENREGLDYGSSLGLRTLPVGAALSALRFRVHLEVTFVLD